jgi:hypothetical protein
VDQLKESAMMPTAHKRKTLVAATAMISAAAVTATSFYVALHSNSGLPGLVAGQALPAGFTIMKKQVAQLWPCLSVRLKLSKKENCHANT